MSADNQIMVVEQQEQWYVYEVSASWDGELEIPQTAKRFITKEAALNCAAEMLESLLLYKILKCSSLMVGMPTE